MSDQGQFAKGVGARLRRVRERRDMSLRMLEVESGGRWKASVVGSWERGDRAMRVEYLAGLAEFYGVPVLSLVPCGKATRAAQNVPSEYSAGD